MIATILTFSRVYNRGANMQCYALKYVLEKMGCEVLFLDAQLPRGHMNLKGKIFEMYSNYVVSKFRKKNHFRYTRSYRSYEELVANPPKTDVFIVGSDQVWNPDITRVFDPRVYFASYMKGCKKISYAASFGKDYWTQTPYDFEIRKSLEEFDAIGVREPSGKDICEKSFGIKNVEWVVDPTLLLSDKDLQMLLKKNKVYRKYVYTYLLHDDKVIDDIVLQLIEKSKLYSVGFNRYHSSFSTFRNIETIEGWLNKINNATLVITNSFHCMVMCLLLHKPFWVIPTFKGREVRMTSLLNYLFLDHLYVTHDDIEKCDTIPSINYLDVDERLSHLRKKSINFLTNNLK